MPNGITDYAAPPNLCKARRKDACLTHSTGAAAILPHGWTHGLMDVLNQVLSVRHPQEGTLELGFTIVVPPGRLGQFTKVVQFWPRLLVVNRLPRALILEQNSILR